MSRASDIKEIDDVVRDWEKAQRNIGNRRLEGENSAIKLAASAAARTAAEEELSSILKLEDLKSGTPRKIIQRRETRINDAMKKVEEARVNYKRLQKEHYVLIKSHHVEERLENDKLTKKINQVEKKLPGKNLWKYLAEIHYTSEPRVSDPRRGEVSSTVGAARTSHTHTKPHRTRARITRARTPTRKRRTRTRRRTRRR